MREQNEIAKAQLAIATRQAEIQEMLRAPRITIRIIEPGIIVNSGALGGLQRLSPREMEYVFINHSDTGVFLTKVLERFDVIEKGRGLPSAISDDDPAIVHVSTETYVPPHSQTEPSSVNLFGALVGTNQDAFYTTGRYVAFMSFYARFRDEFANRWALGACFIFDEPRRSWILAGNTAGQNYYRKEVASDPGSPPRS